MCGDCVYGIMGTAGVYEAQMRRCAKFERGKPPFSAAWKAFVKRRKTCTKRFVKDYWRESRMSEQLQLMEDVLGEALTGDTRCHALEFAAFLRANEISCVRYTGGYWADKIYFVCNYKDQSVCYISVNEYEKNSWYITGDDSGDVWYEDTVLDEHIKEIAWQSIDICTNYDSCRSCGTPGKMSRKKIFGKEFDNVCPVTIKFTNPTAAAVVCMKKVFEARKDYILKNAD